MALHSGSYLCYSLLLQRRVCRDVAGDHAPLREASRGQALPPRNNPRRTAVSWMTPGWRLKASVPSGSCFSNSCFCTKEVCLEGAAFADSCRELFLRLWMLTLIPSLSNFVILSKLTHFSKPLCELEAHSGGEKQLRVCMKGLKML